jgi:hypothetical protein
MARPFYFWQTVSKKAKLGSFGLKKGQMATLLSRRNKALFTITVVTYFIKVVYS